MSKTVICSNTTILSTSLHTFHLKYHFKLHKMFKPTPVKKSWFIESYRHNQDIHLLYVLAGEGDYSFGDEFFQLKPGQLIIVSNDHPHAAITNPTNPLHIFSLRIGIYSNDNNSFIPSFFKTPFAISILPSDTHKYESILNKLYKYFLEEKPESNYAINSLISQLFLNVCDERHNNRSYNTITSITNKIIHCHGIGLNVSDLAIESNLSQKQFTRLFQKYNQITPYQFIIRTKINYATYLLEETNLSVNEIASETGYPDAFCFSKQFKKVLGKSPSIYRKDRFF